MAHEMAHYADIIGGLKKSGFIGSRSGSRLLISDKSNLVNESFTPYLRRLRASEEIMNEMYKLNGIDISKMNDFKLAGEVRRQMSKLRYDNGQIFGTYSYTNISEFIAMAVQYEYSFPGKNKIAEQITRLVFARYKEAFK
jgi:hypothetical protein